MTMIYINNVAITFYCACLNEGLTARASAGGE